MAGWGTAAVVVHAAVSSVHGRAHAELGVGLSPAQVLFVYVVILAAPVVAAILLWTRWSRAGAVLLAVSMAASLVFGVYHHFIAISPDHIAHLPAGLAETQRMFRLTAALLAVTEALGAGVGVWAWKSRR